MAKKESDITNIIDNNTLNVKLKEAKNAKASLRQMTGTFIGRKYLLNKGVNYIGRDPGLDITVPDASVSRRHAELVYDGELLEVIDKGSTNGTFINDKKIKRAVINTNDLLRVGNIIFKYSSHGDLEGVFQDELHNLAHLDGLTGAYNRKYIIEFLTTEIKRCKDLNLPLSLIMLDLDHFKNINDKFGHLAGDFVLKECINLIKEKVLRVSDVLGRYGGEEFLIILSEAPVKRASEVAERTRVSIEEHKFEYNNKILPVTASLGVAGLSNIISTTNEIIEEADNNLYKAKNDGRNKVCF